MGGKKIEFFFSTFFLSKVFFSKFFFSNFFFHGQRRALQLVLYMFILNVLEKQMEIFDPTPNGSRKVVFATNIAETSLTIEGIMYVVDSGKVKQSNYKHCKGIDSLLLSQISQAEADQRSGRAGRTGPGIAYRLYTEQFYW